MGDAALYWRVEGRASRALNCLSSALHFSPRDKKVSELFIYEPSGLLFKVKLLVMHNLAALYWRIEGRASSALNCLTFFSSR